MASGNGISGLLNFKIFWGSMPPDPARDWRHRRASGLPPPPPPPCTQISRYGHVQHVNYESDRPIACLWRQLVRSIVSLSPFKQHATKHWPRMPSPKEKVKNHANGRRHAQQSTIQIGDMVLVKQPNTNKLSTSFATVPR